ncbi:MAG: hypothetical protein DWG76_05045 [Chloroflexi bacterium]|nr:hypothetical protein [Chloroflexota bacterium]
MYWYRSGSALSLLPWLAIMAIVWLAGWLIASQAFRLPRRERLIVGFGLGLVLYTWLVNIAGQLIPPTAAFVLPAILLLVFGGWLAWRNKEEPRFDRADFRVWPWLLAGLFFVWVFLLIGKGLALFDEHKNLSLISMIANGDIAPHFFPNYPLKSIYHYGFHIFGASLMRLGGMLPWSAFDLAKAILFGVSLLLAGLLGRRYTGKKLGGWVAAGVLAFATGTRYLLFLLPPGLLQRADQLITLQGTSAFIGKPFSEALASGWTIDGGPPMDYIFGFLNGVMDPLVMAHQGPNTFSVLIFLLVWLLLTRLKGRWAFLILAPLFAMWALAWEATYALFMLGLFLFAAIMFWRTRTLNLAQIKPTLYAALLSVPIVLVQGGTITELARDLLFGIEAQGLLSSVVRAARLGAGISFAPAALPALADGFLGFSLRWPPAILSAHLGALSVFSPVELIVGLFELGPVIVFTPWISAWAWRRSRAGDWPLGVLLVASWVGFLMPMFLEYQADRDISRLSWQALLTWTLMLVFVVFDRGFRWRRQLRNAAMIGLALMVFGGLVVMGIQLTAAGTTQLAHTFNDLDSTITSQVWGAFGEEDTIFGPLGNTTVITGQLTGRLLGEFPADHLWSEMSVAPTLDGLLSGGFEFVFVDSRDWKNWPLDSQTDLRAPCIEVFAEVWDNSGVNFRRILDLRPCYQ